MSAFYLFLKGIKFTSFIRELHANGMKIADDIKSNIQTFVYFLFKGTFDQRLIQSEFDYLDILLNDSDLLYNCFEIFAFCSQQPDIEDPQEYVADYILAIHKMENSKNKTIDLNEVKNFNSKTKTLWNDFLKLSKSFCHNDFPISVTTFDLKELKGCGTDSVPYFAVWTNVVEVDTKGLVTNSEYALKRANQRLKLWDKTEPLGSFDESELEQEIY